MVVLLKKVICKMKDSKNVGSSKTTAEMLKASIDDSSYRNFRS